MAEEGAGLELLDYPGEVLQKVVDLLAGVGVEVSPLVTQVFLLVLVLAVLVVFRRKLWPPARAERLALVAGMALLLVALGLLGHWARLLVAPLPDHVQGRVIAADLHQVRVALLDHRGEALPAGSGVVDTGSGEFALRYHVGFGDRPRTLVVRRPGCVEHRVPLGLAALRAGSCFEVEFTCEERP